MSEIIRTTVEENDANIIKHQVMNDTTDGIIRHQVRGLEGPAPEPPVLETLNVTENGTYTPEEGVDGFNVVNVDVEFPGDDAYDIKSATPGAIVNFNDGQALPLAELKIDIEPIQGGSGWTECNISAVGTNIWDEEWENGRIDTSTGNTINDPNYIMCKNYINTKPNTTYLAKITNDSSNWAGIGAYDKDKNFIEWLGGKNSGSTFTTPNNCFYIRFYINSGYGTTYNNDISINYPATDTSYHAYNGNTYNIQFPSGVTISNGSIDILNGVLTDNDLSETYNITPIAIRSLEGVNNVFADTGNIEQCDYFYKVTVAGDDLISQIKVVDVEGTPTIKDIKRDFALTGNNAISITNGNIDFGSDNNCFLNCQVSQMNLIPYVIETDIVTCGFETDTVNNKMRGIFTFGQNKSTLWGLFFNTIATEEAGKGTLTFRPQLNVSADSGLIAPSDLEGLTLKLYCNCGLDGDNNIIYDKNNALIFLDDDLLINGDFSNYAGENWGEMCSMGWSSYNWGCPGLVISEYRVKELSTLLGGN